MRWKPQVSSSRRGAEGDDAGRVDLDLAVERPACSAVRPRAPSAGAEQLERQPDRVAAHVGQRAAAERGVQPDVGRVRQQEVERAVDLGGLADRPVGQQRGQAPVLGLEREDERLPQRRGGRGRRVEHLPRLVGLAHSGFSRQHRLARAQRPDGPLGVQGVGQRHVDGVDVAATRQARRSPRRPRRCRWPAANAAARARSRLATRAARPPPASRRPGQELRPGDVGSANDAPANRVRLRHLAASLVAGRIGRLSTVGHVAGHGYRRRHPVPLTPCATNVDIEYLYIKSMGGGR